MSNHIRISDMTMKQIGAGGNFSLSFKEKIELSKILEKLGVDVIEIEGIMKNRADELRIKSIASVIINSILAAPVELNEESVERTFAALKEAKHPRLQVIAPVSVVQMEYLFHMKAAAMLEAITNTVRKCRELCDDVEFIADDATRCDSAFAADAIKAAIEAGATTVTICDTAGSSLPEEISLSIAKLKETIPEIEKVTLGVSCSNELSMADACAIAAVRAGAGEVKCASYAVNTVSLANIVKIIAHKGDSWNINTGVRTSGITRNINKIYWMCQTDRSNGSPFDTGVSANEEELFLDVNDTLPNVLNAARTLGYDLSDEDGVKVYDSFLKIVTKKEKISFKELDAIIASNALQVPETYKIDNYVINSGNLFSATAHISLKKDEQTLEAVCIGDGPIDAAFLAIEQIIGKHFELDDFQIRAITEGREAMGEAIVKLRHEGRVFSGRGISTDIVASSILAYVNALNKVVYEEEAK